MSDECLYGMTHADGEACGGYAYYDPEKTNAREGKGAWIHTQKDGSDLYETDFCSSCGLDLRDYKPTGVQA